MGQELVDDDVFVLDVAKEMSTAASSSSDSSENDIDFGSSAKSSITYGTVNQPSTVTVQVPAVVQSREYTMDTDLWGRWPKTAGYLSEDNFTNWPKFGIDITKALITFIAIFSFFNLWVEQIIEKESYEQFLAGIVLTVVTDIVMTALTIVEKSYVAYDMLNFERTVLVGDEFDKDTVELEVDEDNEEADLIPHRNVIPFWSKRVWGTVFPSGFAFFINFVLTGLAAPFAAGGVGGTAAAAAFADDAELPVLASSAITAAAVTIFFVLLARIGEGLSGSPFAAVHQAREQIVPSLK